MTRFITVIAVCVSSGLSAGADVPVQVAGEWKTTLGPVRLEPPNGGEVKGKLVFYRLDLKGKVDDKGLKLSYDQGPTHVDATWAFEPGGNSFAGSLRASNGNEAIWNGWRADPAASSGVVADFSGLWLTDMGLMELIGDGSKIRGRYAFRGTSSLNGTVKGRHLDFRIKAFQTGPGFFDLDPKTMTLSGAGGTDGMPAWYGWKGRKASEYVKHVPLVAGQILDGSTENLLTYTVRAPDGYRPDDARKWPTILILHGSNMNGKAYVNTIAAAWPDIARDYILLGINGEIPSNIAADSVAFNYSYVNYAGRSTHGGYPGTDRESPALVSEAMDDLKNTYPIKDYFVGGHSQGGFLTYSLLMNSPEQIAGAFPISATVIMQCEPSAYDDKPLEAAQRRIPLAIVHGKNDPIVGFDGGSYAAGLFLDGGWPATRFFTDDNAGHMFGLLPINKAIRWLEALNADDPTTLLDFADRRLKEKSPRDAIAALRKVRVLTLEAPTKARLDQLTQVVDEQAAPQTQTYLAAIKANQDNKWVDGFLAYRDDFQYADSASAVMAEFDALRDQHNLPAQKLMGEARGAFQQGKRDDGYAKAQEVVDHYYASTSYRTAQKWVAEKK